MVLEFGIYGIEPIRDNLNRARSAAQRLVDLSTCRALLTATPLPPPCFRLPRLYAIYMKLPAIDTYTASLCTPSGLCTGLVS